LSLITAEAGGPVPARLALIAAVCPNAYLADPSVVTGTEFPRFDGALAGVGVLVNVPR
jgi:hypothetical protein